MSTNPSTEMTTAPESTSSSLKETQSATMMEVDRVPDLENGGSWEAELSKEQQTTSQEKQSDTSASLPEGHSLVAKRRVMFAALIVLVGVCASVTVFSMGIVSVKKEQTVLFEKRSEDISRSIEAAWAQYELFGLWIHESCFSALNETLPHTATGRLGFCSREKFDVLVESIASVGLSFKAAGFIPNVTHAERAVLEDEARAYYTQNYPYIDYQGFLGFVPVEGTGEIGLGYQVERPFYFPVHYLSPLESSEGSIDFDLYSHPVRRAAIDRAMDTWKPVVTDRIKLAIETQNAYSVLAFHPGVKTKNLPLTRPRALSSLAIRIPDLIDTAARSASVSISVSIFDATEKGRLPHFLGGADIFVENEVTTLIPLPEMNLTDVEQMATRYQAIEVQVADRSWIIAVTSLPDTFEDSLVFVILGGTIILGASIILALWFFTNMGRMVEMQKMKVQAEAEKAAIIVETARQQAVAERQLNEYIAHEVRNPLCSAITALSFVTATTKEPIQSLEAQQSLQEDVGIIDASLQFINELLRNMLDMHKAADKQIKISKGPTDLLNDVFQPVVSILHMRGNKVKILVECPENLVVNTDRMRLKQIALNLAINASKFVEQGYIRLKAEVVDNNVRLYFEDSGPGIPLDKRRQLFVKFQESLDLLNQGTGIGLCLCKHLTELLGGELWLDESFESGVEGCLGTRFVLDLCDCPQIGALEEDESLWHSTEPGEFILREDVSSPDTSGATPDEILTKNDIGSIPESLSALFVDDDLVIRKLFCRALGRAAPGWKIDQASNGETAIQMCSSTTYDIIFIDQYMASVEKQLLGTETVREMRAQGVKSIICGLSANNMEDGFMDAGADSFMFKPFPCEKESFTRELCRIIH